MIIIFCCHYFAVTVVDIHFFNRVSDNKVRAQVQSFSIRYNAVLES